MDCTIYVAKPKALISCAVTVQLICAFFSHMQKAGFLITRLKYEPMHVTVVLLNCSRSIALSAHARQDFYYSFISFRFFVHTNIEGSAETVLKRRFGLAFAVQII